MSGFGLKRPKASPIALDFGASALKALQVVPGAPPKMVASAMIETPEDLLAEPLERLNYQFSKLPELLSSAKFIGKRAACSVSAAQTLVQHVQISADDPDVTGSSIAAVADSLSCDPGQLVARTQAVTTVMRGNQKRTETVCIAIPRAVVNQYMAALASAKLKTVGIHAEHFATLHAFDNINQRATDSQTTHLYLDLGAATSKIVIAHGATMVLAKTLELSAKKAVTGATARARSEAVLVDMESDPDGSLVGGEPVADQRTGEPAPGMADIDAPTQGATYETDDRTVGELIDELRAAVRYHAVLFPGREIDDLIFVGGCAADTTICQRIAQALRLPAQLADPLSRIDRAPGAHTPMDCSSPQPGWALAYGLTAAPTEE